MIVNKSEVKQKSTLNNLYLCDTPYQLFNMMNHCISNNYDSDLVMVDNFNNASVVFERLTQKHIFNNIYFAKSERAFKYKNDLVRHIATFFELLLPKMYIKRQVNKFNFKKKYDLIFWPTNTHLFSCILKTQKNAENYLIEDGTGSYSNSIISGNNSRYNMFNRFLGTSISQFNPKGIYLNNPDMLISSEVKKIPLPKLTKEFLDIANYVYGINNEKYDYKYVFLSQPNDGNEQRGNFLKKVSSCLLPYKMQTIIRLHPREKVNDKYSNFNIDLSNEMWELKIANSIENFNNKVLIGYYSTAQFTPKLIYNCEPTLIFLYKMDPFCSEASINYLDKEIAKIKKMYKEKKKIIIPSSIDEYKKILAEIEYEKNSK